jgi:radical SAM superfamily enzyme YgiQ (UPF0313 family)
MKVKLILPALTDALSPFWRPIKYSLFPPLGIATLAGYFSEHDEIELVDEHVEQIKLDDQPDLVCIEVYITNAKRSYFIADHYRSIGVHVILGGVHVTSLPEEAAQHADTIVTGPAEGIFDQFIKDFKNRRPQSRYFSLRRDLSIQAPMRRDLIKSHKYFVPNSLVVSRGCPHSCDFCYKHEFFKNGKSFYTEQVDSVLKEINQLAGRHLYFLDDHLFGKPKFINQVFDEMYGMNRIFQGAATIDSILNEDTVDKAAKAGLRSLFIGFESISENNLHTVNKKHSTVSRYAEAIAKLKDLGIMINGSFVFGLDNDDKDVFRRTVDWAINSGITTATFHILTPYPGTRLYKTLDAQQRITDNDWNLYDTRHAVYLPKLMSRKDLEEGYQWSYKEFYKWSNIIESAKNNISFQDSFRHAAIAGGWKKLEPMWNLLIKISQAGRLRPLLEKTLKPQ